MTRTNKKTSPSIIHKPTAVSPTSERPSLGQTMKEGFGFGVGASLAQNAVNSAINFFSVPKTSNPVENTKVQEYKKCMEYSSNDTDLCKTLLNS